jgi:hypothetical protein
MRLYQANVQVPSMAPGHYAVVVTVGRGAAARGLALRPPALAREQAGHRAGFWPQAQCTITPFLSTT